jgi:hypothetical protein
MLIVRNAESKKPTQHLATDVHAAFLLRFCCVLLRFCCVFCCVFAALNFSCTVFAAFLLRFCCVFAAFPIVCFFFVYVPKIAMLRFAAFLLRFAAFLLRFAAFLLRF